MKRFSRSTCYKLFQLYVKWLNTAKKDVYHKNKLLYTKHITEQCIIIWLSLYWVSIWHLMSIKNTVKDKSDVYHKTRTNLYIHMVHAHTCTCIWTQNLSLLTTNKQKKLPYCTNTSISFTLKTLERKETKQVYCKDHWQIFNLDINHKWFINNSTLNCFHVVKSTNFYQIPWLEENEMGKKAEIHVTSKSSTLYHDLLVTVLAIPP